MKSKVLLGVLIAGLLFALPVFAGGAGEAEAESPQGDPEFVRVGTASLGGNFFPMGAALAVVIDQSIPEVKSSAQATGGSAFNMNAIQSGELEVALAQGTAVAAAILGTGQFEGNPTDRVRTVANYNATPQHVLVRANSDVDNLEGLRGMRLEMIGIGDGVEVSSRKLLSAVGIEWDEIRPEYSGNRVQAASRLKTGQVDGIIDGTGVGASWLVDVIGNGRLELISLTDSQLRLITEEYPEFSPVRIPAGTYEGQTEEVVTVSNWTVIVCHESLSDDLVYDMTKAIFENQSFLQKQHAYFTDLAPENIVDAYVAPLHPGAERYYKEIGVLP